VYTGRIFGWHIDANNPMKYGIADTHKKKEINGGFGLAHGDHYRITFYIEVDDLQAFLNKSERLGGKAVMPPTEIGYVVTLAQFSDPEGNIIGLIKG
jgi:predicted enzyme related to lactoylglutathione lyase